MAARCSTRAVSNSGRMSSINGMIYMRDRRATHDRWRQDGQSGLG